MDYEEREKYISNTIKWMKEDLLRESVLYPDKWDQLELRWRIADSFRQITLGTKGERNKKRYQAYKRFLEIHGLDR